MRSLLCILSTIALGFFLPRIFGGSAQVYSMFVVVAIFAVMAYGVDVVWSDLGEVSLAHTAFFAAAAYTTGLLAARHGTSPWFTLLASLAAAMALAFALGLATLRTREFMFSLVTYAASIVCLNIAQNWSAVGGSDGIVGIPPLDLSIGSLQLVAQGNSGIWPYAYGLLVLTILFIRRFRKSTLGHAALMVHMNPKLALLNGQDPRRIRLRVFVLSAGVTSLAGWLYAYQRSYVGPDLFETYFLVQMLTAVILSGRRVLLGPLIGTALLVGQKSFFSYGGYFDKVVLGAVLIFVLAAYPRGLVGLWEALARALRRRPARFEVEPAGVAHRPGHVE